MLKIIRSKEDYYPKTFKDNDNEVYLVTYDHCGFLRIIWLKQGGHIFSSEYTSLDEILNEYDDEWTEIETEIVIK